MKTSLLSIFTILFLGIGNTYSRSDGNGIGPKFGFNAGISHYQVQENNLNGLIHRGPGFNVSALYSNFSRNAIQRLEISGGLHLLQSKFEPEAGTYLIQTCLHYKYQRQVTSSGGGIDLFLGGLASMDARQGIYQSWDLNHFHWLTSYSLGISGTLSFEFTESKAITLELGIPVLSLISRTPARQLYHEDNPQFSYVVRKIHENPSLGSWNEHLSMEMKLSFHKKVKERFSHSLFWEFNYVNNNEASSNQVRFLNQALGIEFLF